MYVSRDSGEKDGFEIRLAPYTFIEFYDPSQTENICASLSRPPEKLIVFGGHPAATERFCAVYRDIMGKRGFDIPAEAVWVNPNNASDVESELRRVIVSEKENGRACAVDLTGGSDLCLFAAGRVAADYPDLRFHRYSVSRRIIYDSDPSGIRLGALEVPPLQMDELVRLCSGELMECAMRHSDPLSIPERAEERLGPVWDACRKNPAGWNRMTGELAKCLADPPEAVPAGLKRFLASWERLGYLRSDTDGGKFRVSFSDGASKLLLTRSGLALEWKTFFSAAGLCGRKSGGSRVYDDAAQSVLLDWGKERRGTNTGNGVRNEIDVLLLDGMVPVLISCKNGDFDAGELYKLNAVATEFRLKEIKKAVLFTRDPDGNAADLRNRAKEMGILMRRVDAWTDEDWTNEIRDLSKARP